MKPSVPILDRGSANGGKIVTELLNGQALSEELFLADVLLALQCGQFFLPKLKWTSSTAHTQRTYLNK